MTERKKRSDYLDPQPVPGQEDLPGGNPTRMTTQTCEGVQNVVHPEAPEEAPEVMPEMEIYRGLSNVLQMLVEDVTAAPYDLVLTAMRLAYQLGYPVGVRPVPKEPHFIQCFIELPTGQVAWTVRQHNRAYDGHSRDERTKRAFEYAERGRP